MTGTTTRLGPTTVGGRPSGPTSAEGNLATTYHNVKCTYALTQQVPSRTFLTNILTFMQNAVDKVTCQSIVLSSLKTGNSLTCVAKGLVTLQPVCALEYHACSPRRKHGDTLYDPMHTGPLPGKSGGSKEARQQDSVCWRVGVGKQRDRVRGSACTCVDRLTAAAFKAGSEVRDGVDTTLLTVRFTASLNSEPCGFRIVILNSSNYSKILFLPETE